MTSGIYSLRQQTVQGQNIVTTPVASSNTSFIEYLVVGGGGGGGRATGAGGGAGGLLFGMMPVAVGTNYTITVGAAGAAGSSGCYSRVSDGTSCVTACGGGYGASQCGYGNYPNGGNGGSGGGAYRYGVPGQGKAGQGFRGGYGGYYNGVQASGSGGGAGSQGGDVVYNTLATIGGHGIGSNFSGTVTAYASGGTGTPYPSNIGWCGATTSGRPAHPGGGGAYNGCGATPSNGATNTGGGGGGRNCGSGTASLGGSGVVIIRYPDSFALANTTTGTPTVSTSGGFRIYKFTGSGSIKF